MMVTPLLYTTQQIREIEQQAQRQNSLTAEMLMQRAGRAALKVLQAHWPAMKRVLVVCGTGNNGGDGYVLARLVREQGMHVSIWPVGQTKKLSEMAQAAAASCKQSGVLIRTADENEIANADVIVDALLGIGMSGTVSPEYRAAIIAINAANKLVLALDVPSGLDANTGYVADSAVKATVTITFLGLKPGLLTGQGPDYCGELCVDTLGIPQKTITQILPRAVQLPRMDFSQFLPPRKRAAHKGDFGHVWIVGGDYGMAGAVRMAAEASARVGTGLTTVITRPEHVAVVVTARPELMCYGVIDTDIHHLNSLLSKATVIVIGPGLGQNDWSSKLLKTVLATPLSLVVDADALNLLANKPIKRDNWVLTPHPGEAARLLQTTVQAIQADRLTAAITLQERFGGVCVLKGAGTIVVGPNGVPAICTAGNPGMASGGMGDVLSGIIGSLLAQGLSIETAASVGVCLHAEAADLAALKGERGLLAMDLMPYLHQLVNADGHNVN